MKRRRTIMSVNNNGQLEYLLVTDSQQYTVYGKLSFAVLAL